MNWTLIRGGHLFAPEDKGTQDLLIIDGRIEAIGANLPEPHPAYPVEIEDAQGQIILPGLIDAHLHLIGASGMGGPTTRTSDLPLSNITEAGVTTVVSPLGADSLSRTIPHLLSRAMQLEAEGLTTYCYMGGWKKPLPTLTGDLQADVAYLDRVLGIKVGIAEPKAPPLSIEELSLFAHATVTGGSLAGKKSVLHVHVGDRPEGLQPLIEMIHRTGLPGEHFVATHVNRNACLFKQSLEYAKSGGRIDITAMQTPEAGYPNAIPPSQAISEIIGNNVPLPQVTLSSDGGAGYWRLDPLTGKTSPYRAGPESVLQTVRALVKTGLSWGDAAHFATTNVADLLGLGKKGRVTIGSDADLIILSPTGELDRVYSRGRLMVRGGKALTQGLYED